MSKELANLTDPASFSLLRCKLQEVTISAVDQRLLEIALEDVTRNPPTPQTWMRS